VYQDLNIPEIDFQKFFFSTLFGANMILIAWNMQLGSAASRGPTRTYLVVLKYMPSGNHGSLLL